MSQAIWLRLIYTVSFFITLQLLALKSTAKPDPWLPSHNSYNVTENITQFMEAVGNMMNDVATRASRGGTKKKFATAVVPYSSLAKQIYGLAQCIPDLSASNCNACLRAAISRFDTNSVGGRSSFPSCSVRYEIYNFFDDTYDFSALTNPPKSPDGNSKRKRRRISLIVGLTTLAAISIMMLYGVWICVRKKKVVKASSSEVFDIKKATLDILQFDLHAIQTATQNFAADNKLGEGGFGEVYKGILENGQEIAVKRLSGNSRQGNAEFKNEVALVAKLRHKNLVTLLGFCVSSEEKILVYEFLHKSSLDKFLNDQTLRQTSLNWQTRFKIIVGIARGILYLHEDSPLKVIHRDLKSSNILLDDDMNPKIADFGLAKLFGVDQTQGDTKRIVGTYGYMAPEYAITGHYSVKSDVYSFGVIILELVSGQMNRFYRRIQLEEALLHRAWRLWNEGESIALVDKTLNNEEFSREEVSKCIHIGLLCIQEDATLRPRMTSIVPVLNGQANNFPMPKPPNFFGTIGNVDDNGIQHNSIGVYTGSRTITDLYSRD